MAITWSTSELEAIKQQTMKDAKPSYYSLTNQSYIQITDDFEGYLILQASEDKQKALTWMADVSKISNNNKDQNALLATFLDVRTTDVEARITELDTKLNKYSDMQATLITDGKDPSRYGDILELNLMIKSISKYVDNILIQREQAFHEQNLIAAITNAVKLEQSNTETEKELTSWQVVMSAYKGQAAKSKSKVGKSALGGVF